MRILITLLFCLPAMVFAMEPKPLPVVTSFSILGDITHQIAGPLIAQHVLVGPDEDAHVFRPKPSDIARVHRARIVIVNGLHFEGWMMRLLNDMHPAPTVIVASAGVPVLEQNGEPDPHAWHSLANIRIYVRNIADALIAALPDHHATIERNTAGYLQLIEALDRERRQAFSDLPDQRRTLITSHDAFGYLAQENNLTFLAPVGMNTEEEPSAQDIAALIREIRAHKITAAFVENITNPRQIKQIVAETGIHFGGVLYSDALSQPGEPAASYLDMMRHNFRTIRRGLAPELHPATAH